MKFFLLAAAALIVAAPVAALPVIADASFESLQLGGGGFLYTPGGTPWTFLSGSGLNSNGGPFHAGAAPDGNQVAFLQDGGGTSRISQTLTGFTIGRSYSFSFFAAQRPGYAVNPITVAFDGMDLGTFVPQSTSFEQVTTASFAATSMSGLLSFRGFAAPGDNNSVFDNVSINESAVPEPGMLALLGLGALGIGVSRRRHRLVATS